MSVNILFRKPNKQGKSYATLKIYYKGVRKSFSPGIYIYNKSNLTLSERNYNKAVREKLKLLKHQKSLELISGESDLESLFLSTDFITYCYKVIGTRGNFHISSLNKLKLFLKKECRSDIKINDINERFLEKYKVYLLESLSPATVKCYMNTLRIVFNQAINDKIVKVNPFGKVKKLRVPDKKLVYLTFEEINKIKKAECENVVIKKAFLFAIHIGARLSDIRDLTYNDIIGNKISFIQKKTERLCEVPLSEGAMQLLDQSKFHTKEKLFPLPSNPTINKHIKKLAADAGVDKSITFRVSRNTFAQLLSEKTGNMKVVSALLGHTSLNTVRHYTTTTYKEKENLLKNFNQLSQGA